MEDDIPKDIPADIVKEASGGIPTRKTLIERLDNNWSDWSSWDEFYRTYSGFVFHVARKSGLSDDESNDVVQETFIGVAKNLQKKKFDTSLGSFKSFLLNQARWRILIKFRRRKKQQSREANLYADETDERRTAPIDRCADPNGMALEKLWDKEWQDKVMDIALRRVRALVSPRQFQIFSCYVLKGWTPERVKKELGVNAAQVYLAKHRVGRILKREAARLAEEEQ